MARTDSHPVPSHEPPPGPSETVRGIISLVLVIHFFAIFIALTCNRTPSVLQERLLVILRPYLRTLNFEVDFIAYDLTQAQLTDADHRIEILEQGADEEADESWRVFGQTGFVGGERYKRFQRYSEVFAAFREDEASTALMAQAVARYWQHFGSSDRPPRLIRGRDHLLQGRSQVTSLDQAQSDPDSPAFFREFYKAEIVINGERIDLVKRAAAAREASPDQASPEFEQQ